MFPSVLAYLLRATVIDKNHFSFKNGMFLSILACLHPGNCIDKMKFDRKMV